MDGLQIFEIFVLFFLGMIFMGFLFNVVMFFNEDEHSTIFGGRFVRVDAEPEGDWCEAWEYFDCVPEGCNDGGVYYSQSFISLKFLIIEDVNGQQDTSIESTNCECHSKKRFWRRC